MANTWQGTKSLMINNVIASCLFVSKLNLTIYLRLLTWALNNFRLPKGQEFEVDHNKLYDKAYGSHGNCSALYPGCKDLHGLQLYESE